MNLDSEWQARAWQRLLVLACLLGWLGLLGGCGGGEDEEPVRITNTVSVSVVGSGTVTSVSGINCGSTCSTNIPVNTGITLTANAAAGHVLQAWGGACAGVTGNSCTVAVTQTVSVTATFVAQPVALHRGSSGKAS